MEIPKYEQPSEETLRLFREAMKAHMTPEHMAAKHAIHEERLNRRRNNRNVYFIVDDGLVKVGVSEYPESRLDAIKTSRPSAKLLGYVKGGFKLEKEIHNKLEKFKFGREWFYYSQEVHNIIEGYLK
jgi:hypothetical protein